MRAAWLVLASVGLACSGGGSGDAVIAEDSLAAIVLQPDDLPADYSLFDEGRQAIADAPAGERADPRRFGRRDGWKARYRRADAAALDGALVVESRADLFADAEGAEREFAAYSRELESGGLGGGDRRAVEDLGDEAVLVTQGSSDAPDTLITHIVLWRDRNVTGAVVANGLAGRFPTSDAIALARAQQRRIEAADQE